MLLRKLCTCEECQLSIWAKLAINIVKVQTGRERGIFQCHYVEYWVIFRSAKAYIQRFNIAKLWRTMNKHRIYRAILLYWIFPRLSFSFSFFLSLFINNTQRVYNSCLFLVKLFMCILIYMSFPQTDNLKYSKLRAVLVYQVSLTFDQWSSLLLL